MFHVKSQIWEFPKIRGTLYFGGPYNKDPTIEGTIVGSPIFGKSHIRLLTVSLYTVFQRVLMVLNVHGLGLRGSGRRLSEELMISVVLLPARE